MIHRSRALTNSFCHASWRICNRETQISQKIVFNHFFRSLSSNAPTRGITKMPNIAKEKGPDLNGSADDIIDSAAATAQWKRSQYRKIEDKFDCSISQTDTQQLEPLNIENYDDVQPMWKEMESRVTRRRSLTLEQLKQRGGVSGRRNIRKSEEDYWEEAGVYDENEKKDS